MINKEVYENITEEKLCFCDGRPDREIYRIVDYLWKDERKDYYGDYPNGIDNHIFNNLVKLVQWMKTSITSDRQWGRDYERYYSDLINEKKECDSHHKTRS
jgi:hypothetical protein